MSKIQKCLGGEIQKAVLYCWSISSVSQITKIQNVSVRLSPIFVYGHKGIWDDSHRYIREHCLHSSPLFKKYLLCLNCG